MLSSSFRCDQIHKCHRYDNGHTLLCYLDVQPTHLLLESYEICGNIFLNTRYPPLTSSSETGSNQFLFLCGNQICNVLF
jgi:hypothetical protein